MNTNNQVVESKKTLYPFYIVFHMNGGDIGCTTLDLSSPSITPAIMDQIIRYIAGQLKKGSRVASNDQIIIINIIPLQREIEKDNPDSFMKPGMH